MMFAPIITSKLNQDLYKYTMAQAVLHNFPDAWTRIVFKCRSDVNLAKYVDEINRQLDFLCDLRYKTDELNFLSKFKFFTRDFIEFLRIFKLNRDFIKAYVDENGELQIVAEGPWIHVIWFEIFVLSIVQEVYTRTEYAEFDLGEGSEAYARLMDKVEAFNAYDKKLPYTFADFGTRRRFNGHWHREVVKTLSENIPRNCFVGTSNVLFAKEFGINAIGTMAHEWLQAGQALGPRLKDSQAFMLETWVQEYRGELGIALSDVVGFNAFLNDFDKYFAKLYDGARHDSGDPFEWGERLIEHYQSFGIDALTKTAVFSDGLTPELAFRLAERFRGRIRTSFGIGTNLTNDVGIKPLQLVMKMVECNGSPVAKISDSPGKGMCEDDGYLAYLKTQFNIKD